MGGPLMGLNRSPMLRTTVLKTLNRAASLGSDTEGGGMSSSRVSPHATWFRSCRWRKADYITTVLKVIFGHFITVMYATTITKAIQMAQCRQSREFSTDLGLEVTWPERSHYLKRDVEKLCWKLVKERQDKHEASWKSAMQSDQTKIELLSIMW